MLHQTDIQVSILKKRPISWWRNLTFVLPTTNHIKPKTEGGTQVLFEPIAHRDESGSLIITSNQPFTQWDQIFRDSVMTFATVDRIIHHAHMIKIERENCQKKQPLKK